MLYKCAPLRCISKCADRIVFKWTCISTNTAHTDFRNDIVCLRYTRNSRPPHANVPQTPITSRSGGHGTPTQSTPTMPASTSPFRKHCECTYAQEYYISAVWRCACMWTHSRSGVCAVLLHISELSATNANHTPTHTTTLPGTGAGGPGVDACWQIVRFQRSRSRQTQSGLEIRSWQLWKWSESEGDR